MLAQLAALAAAILAARTGGSNSGQIAQAAIAGAQGLALQMQINFTRQNEQEADRRRLSRDSTPPASTSTPWRPSWSACSGPPRFVEGNAPSYLRDHPVTYERIAEAQARAQGKPFRQVQGFARLQHGARAGTQLRGHATRCGLVLRGCASRKRNTTTRLRRAMAWWRRYCTRRELQARAGRARDTGENRASASDDRRHGGSGADAGPGSSTRRLRATRSALARYPGKMQLVYDYPEALLEEQSAGKGGRVPVRCSLQHYPTDGPLHQVAARAYAALGKQMLQHQHQGEYYAWQGNLQGAIDQFETGRQVQGRRLLSVVGRRKRAFAH